MTQLSVNLNKIALLRNSRGRDFPNVVNFAQKNIDRGVKGITVHPRQDERHITRQDTRDLAELCAKYDDVEFNVEGYPSEDFMALVEEVNPDQVTLVPDSPDQLTSDHGWELNNPDTLAFAKACCERLKKAGIRSSLFLDPVVELADLAAESGTDRVELYTEEFAHTHGTAEGDAVLARYAATAERAQQLGLGVNAGHDLDLTNLPSFLTVKDILEVSIGHVLTVECIEQGMDSVIAQYLEICANSA